MQNKQLSSGWKAILAILAATLGVTSTPAFTQQEIVIHSFGGNNQNGTLPQSSLILDAAGNLTAPQSGPTSTVTAPSSS